MRFISTSANGVLMTVEKQYECVLQFVPTNPKARAKVTTLAIVRII